MELKEQLLFLKNLKEELNNQDHDCQASPRFWVVMDHGEEPCWDGNAESYHVSATDIGIYGPLDTFVDELKANGYLNEISNDAIVELKEITDEEVLISWLKEYLDTDAYLVPMRTVDVIKKDTFFITKAECEKHIKANKHHYSKRAHTYAMTAWRSPQVEKLWEVLETLDIDKIFNNKLFT